MTSDPEVLRTVKGQLIEFMDGGSNDETCYMASIDIKVAYYSVPIAETDQKYLKFEWQGILYKFTSFPNGLALCPRKFTKLLKPVYCYLRKKGHISSGYIDDSYLQGDGYQDCLANVADTIKLFDSLGFIVHPEKSVFIPTQIITFLGFVLDSRIMTVYLTQQKQLKLKNACLHIIKIQRPTIRLVAQLLGLMTSSFPGVMYGPLYYRRLDMEKTDALSLCWNFEGTMELKTPVLEDITRAQLFEGRLALNPRLNLTQVYFCCVYKHFLG